MSFSHRSGLYVIVDADALGARDPLAFADAVLSVQGLFALQFRAKHWPARRMLSAARSLAERCARVGVPFVINDRPDVAMLCDAPVLHVGQDDLSIEDVRSMGARLMVGVSTHDLAQVDEALALAPDYVAFGPVFDTRSKEAPDPTVGLSLLARAAERANAADIPLVAIGGIHAHNAAHVRAAGARAAAVIGALANLASDPIALVRATAALQDALSR